MMMIVGFPCSCKWGLANNEIPNLFKLTDQASLQLCHDDILKVCFLFHLGTPELGNGHFTCVQIQLFKLNDRNTKNGKTCSEVTKVTEYLVVRATFQPN